MVKTGVEHARRNAAAEILMIRQEQQPAITGYVKSASESKKDEIDKQLGYAWFENAWSFRSVESTSFKKFAELLVNAPKNYKLPDRKALSARILNEVYEESRALVEGVINKSKTTGGALVSDGASVKKRPMINYLYCSIEGVCYLGTEDLSEDLAEGAVKNAEFIFEGWDEHIRTIGPENVVVVITDGASSNQKAWEMVRAKYPFIHTLWCGGHVLNLFLKDVGRIGRGELGDEALVGDEAFGDEAG